jgi:hypothetical protein
LKVLKKFYSSPLSLGKKMETLKMLYMRLLKLKEDIQSITDLEAAH